MKFTDLLALMDPAVIPERAKLHLATSAGPSEPLDAYLAGTFGEWQSWQSKQNFQRDLVVSLIRLPGRDRWLFAGVFDSLGCKWETTYKQYQYELRERETCNEFKGRLVIRYARSGKQAYRNLDGLAEQLSIAEILARPMTVGEFPGFKAVYLSRGELDIVVRDAVESWRVALSSVAGIYLISDPSNGKLYVGSAVGTGGIWQRWCTYSASGHGGNKRLMEIVATGDTSTLQGLRFSILEIADVHVSESDILQRESHWKRILLTRQFGLNAN